MPSICDNGIVICRRVFEDKLLIITCFMQQHGMIRGVWSQQRSVVPNGSAVQANWRARLPEQLGYFTLEIEKDPSIYNILLSPRKSSFLNAALELIHNTVPLRNPQPSLWYYLNQYREKLSTCFEDRKDPVLSHLYHLLLYCDFERVLLEESGYSTDSGLTHKLLLQIQAELGSSPTNSESVHRHVQQVLSIHASALVQCLLPYKELPALRGHLVSTYKAPQSP